MTTISPRSTRVANPWVRAIVIFGILFAAIFAFPGGLADWLDERNADGWLSAPLAAMRGVDAVSAALGVKQVGQGLKRAFGDWVGAE
jgi:hypothetical protein